ncbi:hypothetical protein KJ633_09355 [bacterium]|nr:hypothetical protein [bacterium]MBU3956648.1 hypothetical protein [bacterium]
MSNAVIVTFTLLAALGIYFSRRYASAFLLPWAGALIIAVRTGFVFFSPVYILAVSAAGFIFLALGKFFPHAKKQMSACGVIAVWILMLIRIC